MPLPAHHTNSLCCAQLTLTLNCSTRTHPGGHEKTSHVDLRLPTLLAHRQAERRSRRSKSKIAVGLRMMGEEGARHEWGRGVSPWCRECFASAERRVERVER
jgi:hypothetical protein